MGYTLMDLKGATFVILKNHANMPVSKEKLSPMRKGGRPAKFMEKSRMLDELKALEKSIVAIIVQQPGLGLKHRRLNGFPISWMGRSFCGCSEGSMVKK